MTEMVTYYAFYIDDSREDSKEEYGFRFVCTQPADQLLPRMHTNDVVIISQEHLQGYLTGVEEADNDITFFLFEIERGPNDADGGETVTGFHSLTGIRAPDYPTADTMANDAAEFPECAWDVVVDRVEALALFQIPHPSFYPVLGTLDRFH